MLGFRYGSTPDKAHLRLRITVINTTAMPQAEIRSPLSGVLHKCMQR